MEFRWADESGDRIGSMDTVGRPDGNKDQHLVVTFEFPAGTSLEGLSVTGGGNNRWVTQPSDRYWPLALYRGEEPVTPTYTPKLGEFSGRQRFDLYGNTPGEIREAEFELQAEVKIQGQTHTLTGRCKKP